MAVPLKPAVGGGYGYLGYLTAVDQAVGPTGIIYDESASLQPIGCWAGASGKAAWSCDPLTRSAQSVAAMANEPVAGEDIALLQLTSGSTSQPKPVIVTHRMIVEQIGYLVAGHRAYAGQAPAVMGSWMPVHHDAGLFMDVLVPLALGCDNLLASPRHYVTSSRRWFELMAARGVEANFVTNSAAVAAVRSLGQAARDGAAWDLSGLHILLGAEKQQLDVFERFERMMACFGMQPGQIHIGCGMAETTLGITRTGPGPVSRTRVVISDDQRVTPAVPDTSGAIDLMSVGRALPGSAVAIRSGDGQLLGDDRLGQVWLSGPCITPGYFRNPATTAERFRGRWMASGDLGFMRGGELFFVDRLDDVLNIVGVKVIPEDVEQAVDDRVDEVRPGGACLIGERNALGVEPPTLLVELKTMASTGAGDDWLTQVRRLLVEGFDLLGARVLPVTKGTVEKTSTCKKRRKVIAERLARGEIAPLDQPPQSPRPRSGPSRATAFDLVAKRRKSGGRRGRR